MTKRVLGIDPGSACGWAIVRFPECIVVERGVWTLQHSRLEGGGMMFLRLRRWLEEAVGIGDSLLAPLDLVAIEDVKAHKGTQASHLYGGITATITSVLEDACLPPYTGVGVGTWKKIATGKGNASKDQVRDEAMIRWGHRGVGWYQDEADAAFVALAAGMELGWHLAKRSGKTKGED